MPCSVPPIALCSLLVVQEIKRSLHRNRSCPRDGVTGIVRDRQANIVHSGHGKDLQRVLREGKISVIESPGILRDVVPG